MINIKDFSYSLPIQARWNDLDPLGHVNNSIYVGYFELGRGRYMDKASKTWNWNEHMFLLGKIEAIFLKELTLNNNNPTVWTRTSRFGNKSFDLEYAVTSLSKDSSYEVHCTGMSTQIMYDVKSKTTIKIPEWLISELTNFEKRV